MQDKDNHTSIIIGHYNWHQLAEQGGFYPDDLPQDWQLSFYSNEFECVELQVDQYSPDELAELCEDLPESFQMLVRASSTVQCEKAVAQMQLLEVTLLDTQCHAVNERKELILEDKVICYADAAKSLKQWKEFIAQWSNTLAGKRGILLLDATHISAAQATELRLMIEMMGL